MTLEVTSVSASPGATFATVQLTQTDQVAGLPPATVNMPIPISNAGTYVVGQTYDQSLTPTG